jgi:hypothetical protein
MTKKSKKEIIIKKESCSDEIREEFFIYVAYNKDKQFSSCESVNTLIQSFNNIGCTIINMFDVLNWSFEEDNNK